MSISCLICTDSTEKTNEIRTAIKKYCTPDLQLDGISSDAVQDAASGFHPHIVVLDLDDPFEGILRFTEKLKALHPAAYYIVFIQFKEFSFAHSMSLERVEFLPKPWRPDSLQESITRTVNLIDMARKDILSTGKLESVVNDNIPVIRQHYLSLLMRSGGSDPDAVRRKFRTLQIDCPGPNYTVVIVDIPEERGKENYEALSFLVLSSMKSMLKTEGYQVYIFFDSEYRINCLIGHESRLQSIGIREVVLRLDEYCLLYMGLQLRFGIGCPVDSVSDVHLSFDDAERDLRERGASLGQNNVRPFQEALDYIDRHLSNPKLDLKQISAFLGFSRTYFSRSFQRYQGKGFSACLREKRISKAKELLADSELTLTEIAQRTGFSSVKYFATVFKSEEGITPVQYRRKQGMSKKDEILR